jgi:hypothetical protein
MFPKKVISKYVMSKQEFVPIAISIRHNCCVSSVEDGRIHLSIHGTPVAQNTSLRPLRPLGKYLSQRLQNKWMFQRLRRCDPLLRIKRQTPIQQVSKESQFLSFRLSETLRRRHEACSEIAGWFRKGESFDGVLEEKVR